MVRYFIIALVTGILISSHATAQNRRQYQSEKLHRRYEDDKLKEQQESLQRQPSTVIDIPKITFLFPGFSYEKAIGRFQTLHAYALYNLYTYTVRSGGVTHTTSYFDPTFMLAYRLYCNHDRRQGLGKPTERNTMNYVSPFAQVFFSKTPIGNIPNEYDKRRPVYVLGALYGLQRNYNSRFSLDINFGLGVISGKTHTYNTLTGPTDESQSQVTVPGQITLGFWLGK